MQNQHGDRRRGVEHPAKIGSVEWRERRRSRRRMRESLPNVTYQSRLAIDAGGPEITAMSARTRSPPVQIISSW